MRDWTLGFGPTARRLDWKVGLVSLLRIALTLSALAAAYFLLPVGGSRGEPDPWRFVLQLLVFGIVGAVQLPAIVRSDHPVARATEALALTVPLFVLMFARIYLETSLHDPDAFTEPLDRTAALYFTVAIFSTVGFGDIVAESGSARLLVVLQMMLNLVLLGVGIRLLASAARKGVARRQGSR